MDEKSVTFCFLKLEAKEKVNFSKIIGGRWHFCGEFRSPLSELMSTHSIFCWSRSMGSGNVKQDIITRSWPYELPHELPNNLGLMILGNEKLLRLFSWVFIDLMIRGFELVTRGFELLTRGFELVTRAFVLVTRGFELVTRRFEPVTRGFELLTRGFELALLNFHPCF